MKLSPRSVAAASASVLLALPLLTSSPAASAVVPRNGTYAGFTGTAMALFKMESRVIRDMTYDVPITCVSRVDGNTITTFFRGGDGYPTNARMPDSLRVRRTFAEVDQGNSGRTATVEVLIDFRGERPRMKVWVDGLSSEETCTGESVIRLRRGPLNPR